jgi:hypothetical protein
MLLPIQDWEVACLVAAVEGQTPLGRPSAAPDAYLGRVSELGVVKLVQIIRRRTKAAVQSLGHVSHAHCDHAVICADELVQELE